ncbi:carboxymethylenebutenolidase homolog isoform X2 [Pangasianodon hypophthalmus]|uniref:carboxymethylenebutenolidase homolog isoform X2 n=1 Tax=Pangasianodon hypophthalmus TaxID=310915 RepID=UPI0023073636|nr:carboxymethylenebutenolidase homolog isoform X2 [Pangasianodon hypophthalmus]
MANEARPCPCDIGDRMEYGSLGEEVQIEHVKAYVVKPKAPTDKAVIVIQDIFGWQLPNTRYMADMLASNGYVEVDVVLKYLKEQRGAKRIGVVGFCWGGVATHYIALQYPEVKAGVSVYGIIKEREDSYELKCPTLFIFGENDTVIPLDQVTTLEAKLKDKCTVDFEVKVFPNQTHGFVHRKREDVNPTDRPFIQEAREDMINWLNKYM